MTLIYELDVDILQMYLRTKIKFLSRGFRKLEHKQDKQTHMHNERGDRTHYHTALAGCNNFNSLCDWMTRVS